PILPPQWHHKGPNQRRARPGGQDRVDGSCAAALLMVQDLGATFGPLEIDLHNWRRVQKWDDGAACRVSMKALPFNGATFGTHRISEEAGQYALKLLRQLERSHLSALLTTSRVPRFDHVTGECHD